MSFECSVLLRFNLCTHPLGPPYSMRENLFWAASQSSFLSTEHRTSVKRGISVEYGRGRVRCLVSGVTRSSTHTQLCLKFSLTFLPLWRRSLDVEYRPNRWAIRWRIGTIQARSAVAYDVRRTVFAVHCLFSLLWGEVWWGGDDIAYGVWVARITFHCIFNWLVGNKTLGTDDGSFYVGLVQQFAV